MRPVSKIQVLESQAHRHQSDDDSEHEAAAPQEVIVESQAAVKQSDRESEALDHDDSRYGDRPATFTSAKPPEASSDAKEVPSKVTKPTKKKVVKPEAHANYVKLKIKNQNTKGNKGKGRFGRKHR